MDNRNETDGSVPSTQRNESSATTPLETAMVSKRKRARGAIIATACNECRKKRAKCDGKQPCRRCEAQGHIECIYEVPIRQSKDHLKKELEALRERERINELVLAGLNQPNVDAEVLTRLKAEQSIESIAAWLETTKQRKNDILGIPPSADGINIMTQPLPSSTQEYHIGPLVDENGSPAPAFNSDPSVSNRSKLQWPASLPRNEKLQNYFELPEPARSRFAAWAETRQVSHIIDSSDEHGGLEQARSSGQDTLRKRATETWTSLTDDVELVEHLLGLYFCWEYPIFASLSKEQFLHDFRDGRPRYCSSLLVNALLALGCRFSSLHMTRADPQDPYSSGQHFFDESLKLLRQKMDHHSLQTIQTLGILSIREASCGHIAEGVAFSGQSMRLAIEMGLHNLVAQPEGAETDEFTVQSATFWGAFSLDHAWSLTTFSPPGFSKSLILPPKPPILPHVDESLWLPYTDSGTPSNSFYRQPSNVRSVFKCFIELSELTHQILYLLRSPEDPITAKRLIGIYTSCATWFDHLPKVLKLGFNFTPAVLFCHMHYHFSILLLFRPFIRLRIAGSGIIPRDVCLQAARAIHGLLRCYAQLYTLKRTPTFLPHYILTSSVTLLVIGILTAPQSADGSRTAIDPGISSDVQRGIDGLAEITSCHHFAGQAVNILRYLSRKWGMHLEMDSRTVVDQNSYETFVEPYFKRLKFFGDDPLVQRLIIGDAKRDSTEKISRQVNEAEEILGNLMLQSISLRESTMFPRESRLAEQGFFKL